MIRAKARLTPPPEAARPGGYDFARDAWFRQTGATGAILGKPAVWDAAQSVWISGDGVQGIDAGPRGRAAGQEASQGTGEKIDKGGGSAAIAPPEAAWSLRVAAWIDNGRNTLTERIAGAWGGQAGAVAAALVTGKRGQITEQTNAWLRAAGIYHIISISGLHMVLAAGMFFWTARALLALSPWCALHLPVRKLAAALAMGGATAYCIFSGSDVATERSLVMILAMLGAILVDRPALSMHNLALAAMVILAREPESLLGPGFQMSFAAVAGLIVLASHTQATPGQPHRRAAVPGLARRMLTAVVAIILTTIVCEMATGPFSIWHFQSVYPLGVIGNAMALPFLSLVVMPAAVVGVALAAVGLDWPVWWVMGAATEPILYVAMRIAATPHAMAGVAAPGATSLLCLSAAIVWFVIWRTPLRWAAAAPAIAGLALLYGAQIPDVMIDRQGRGGLVVHGPGRDAQGERRVSLLGAPSTFVAEQWLRSIGDPRPATSASLRANVRCDAVGCVAIRDDGGAIVWVRERHGMFDDCQRADVIISPHRAPAGCRASVVLDRNSLEKRGAASVFLSEGNASLRRGRNADENWPWTPWQPGRSSPLPPHRNNGASPGERTSEKTSVTGSGTVSQQHPAAYLSTSGRD